MPEQPAPGRPHGKGRPGLVFLLVLLLACDRISSARREARTLPLGKDTIQLAEGVQRIDITMRLHTASHFDPAAATARPGDVVRFIAGDAGTHAIAFDVQALPAAARSFLESKQQLRSPPLVNAGANWVLDMNGAPPGEYPYVCVSHDARGVLRIGG